MILTRKDFSLLLGSRRGFIILVNGCAKDFLSARLCKNSKKSFFD